MTKKPAIGQIWKLNPAVAPGHPSIVLRGVNHKKTSILNDYSKAKMVDRALPSEAHAIVTAINDINIMMWFPDYGFSAQFEDSEFHAFFVCKATLYHKIWAEINE